MVMTDSKAIKREAILKHATEVFAECGFRGTDVQDIANRAEVGKGTVYRYFGSKEDLFWAVIDEMDDRMEAAILDGTDEIESTLEVVQVIGIRFIQFFNDHPHYLELSAQDRAEFRGKVPPARKKRHQERIAEFGKLLVEGVERGELRPLDIDKTINAFGAMIKGVSHNACYHLTDWSMMEVAGLAIDIFIRGIAADPAALDNRTGSEDVPSI